MGVYSKYIETIELPRRRLRIWPVTTRTIKGVPSAGAGPIPLVCFHFIVENKLFEKCICGEVGQTCPMGVIGFWEDYISAKKQQT